MKFFKMYGFRLLISFTCIGICSCSFADIFDEWAKKKEEPPKGYGPYTVVPMYIADCNNTHKKDTEAWVDVTSIIENNNNTYNVIVDMHYPINVRCVKIYYELWIKIDNKVKMVVRRTVTDPCNNLMTFLLFKDLKVIPPCTVVKGHYHFAFEDVDKILHTYIKVYPYVRLAGKLEFYSENGQFSCHLGVGDFDKRIVA